ncbi:MAG: transposase [Myxococcales bacterium]|nr:MAG: transposase [Myxococcales bacterium]
MAPVPLGISSTPRIEVAGFSVFADSRIDAQDKRARTRLCPYLSRPPVATKHLRRYRYGKLIYILKRQ